MKKLNDGYIGDKLKEAFKKVKREETTEGKYKCWDCEKVIENFVLPIEIKEKCPLSIDGYRNIICKECGEKEE